MRQVRRVAAFFVCFLVLATLVGGQSDPIVYVTKTGAKYHTGTCTSLRASKIAMTLSAAAAKYGACKLCTPPVPAAAADASRASTTRPTATAESPAAAAATSAASTAGVVAPKPAPVERAVTSGRCQATTKKGTQCSRHAKAGSSYCWQHGS